MRINDLIGETIKSLPSEARAEISPSPSDRHAAIVEQLNADLVGHRIRRLATLDDDAVVP